MNNNSSFIIHHSSFSILKPYRSSPFYRYQRRKDIKDDGHSRGLGLALAGI